jgi:aminoglycoside phosphotransferase (APT) family kinase protein
LPDATQSSPAHERLREFLREQVGAPNLELSDFDVPAHGGLSNETLLCSARWSEGGLASERELVVRVEPADAEKLFPDTDTGFQCRVMRALAAGSDVPVPAVLWEESSPDVFGRPFYVMERVAGRIPSDMPPYQAAGWLREASPREQARAQSSALDALAGIHRLDWRRLDLAFVDRPELGDPGLEQEFGYWRRYLDWLADGERLPVLERCYAWCMDNAPAQTGPLALNWGDARLGNLIFDDAFEVASILDWEMAVLGPVELDVGWLLFLHATALIWLDDLPGFRDRSGMLAHYEEALGRKLVDLPFFEVWAGFKAAAIRARMVERDCALGGASDRSAREDNPVVTSLRRLVDLGE